MSEKNYIEDTLHLIELDDQAYDWRLGIELIDETFSKDIYLDIDYARLGNELRQAFLYDCYNLICDSKSKEPVEWVTELVSGDIRDILQVLVASICVKFDIGVGLAFPLAGLVIKHGLLKFCKSNHSQSKKHVIDILKEQKDFLEKLTKRK